MKKVLFIMLMLVALLLQAVNPPRNLVAEPGNALVTLTWEAPIIDGTTELFYHDDNPYNAYFQTYGQGYGTVFDLSDYENPVLRKLDFRHSSFDIMGPHNYNLHIVNWITGDVIDVLENLSTTVNDAWEEGIDLGSLNGADLVGIFMEPLSNSSTDAYPVIDCDPSPDALSYVVNVNNDYAITDDPADGDFLMDLWFAADGFSSLQARKMPLNHHPVELANHVMRAPLTEPLPQDNRNQIGYRVYRNSVLLNAELLQTPYYLDTNVTNNLTYNYYVTAVYEGEESVPSETVQAIPSLPADILFYESFEGHQIPTTWTIYDADGDNYNWQINDSNFDAHNGSYCACSASYINDIGPLTPDNWLITPAIALPSDDIAYLRFWVQPQDSDWPNEHYYVKVSTTGTEMEDFTETIYDWTVASSAWHMVQLSLEDYAGENVYIAFEHCEVTDMYYLKIDDVKVTLTEATDGEEVSVPMLDTRCYPNPFNPETTISFTLPEDGNARVDVFNIRGQKVTTLCNERFGAGSHQVMWHGTDDNGNQVSSGIYFYKLNTGNQTLVRKMALMK